jgi:hypothetical protein
MSAVLKQIAIVAKGLNKPELHVLIELASRAEAAGGMDASASSRELAEATGLARSSVQLAIDSLNKKHAIHSDAGAPTRPASHRLIFLDAVEIQPGGPIFRPEVAREPGRGGSESGPVVAQFPGQGSPTAGPLVAGNASPSGLKSEPGVVQLSAQDGLNSGPPPNERSTICESPHIENASASAESIEKDDFDSLIDRLQKSKRGDFDDQTFEEARNLIASHHAKFAQQDCQITGLPDDQITAQFLAIADWPRLHRMLYDLLSERKQSSHSWAWYVTVALQRIHGISPDKLRAIRERLRNTATRHAVMTPPIDASCLVRNPSTSSPRPPNQRPYGPSNGIGGLKEQVRMLAASKSMR